MQNRLVGREILPRRDPFLQRAVNPDLVLVRLPANLQNRARVRDPLKDKRLDPGRPVRLGPAFVDVFPPLLSQVLVGNPLLEDSVEPLANFEQLVLKLAARRSLRPVPPLEEEPKPLAIVV